MKKKYGLARAVESISPDLLEALSTGALLARLQRLRRCEDSEDRRDLSEAQVESVRGSILFKSDPAWRAAYTDLKAVLATWEHKATKPR